MSTLNCNCPLSGRGKSVPVGDNWDVWDLPTKGVSRQVDNKVDAHWILQNIDILMKY